MSQDPVVRAISAHQSSPDGKQASPMDRRAQLGALRCVQQVLTAFKTSPSSEVAHITGCETLADLASDVTRREWLRETAVATGLIEAMARHPTAPRVQLHALTALAMLAMDADHRETIALAGGTQRVVSALEKHPADAELQQFALSALLQLLAEPDQLDAADALGARELGEAALAAFPEHAEIQRLGGRLQQRMGKTSLVEPEVEPEPEPEPAAAAAGSPESLLSPRSAGALRADAYIQSMHATASEAIESNGPSPEAQHRYTKIRLLSPPRSKHRPKPTEGLARGGVFSQLGAVVAEAELRGMKAERPPPRRSMYPSARMGVPMPGASGASTPLRLAAAAAQQTPESGGSGDIQLHMSPGAESEAGSETSSSAWQELIEDDAATRLQALSRGVAVRRVLDLDGNEVKEADTDDDRLLDSIAETGRPRSGASTSTTHSTGGRPSTAGSEGPIAHSTAVG